MMLISIMLYEEGSKGLDYLNVLNLNVLKCHVIYDNLLNTILCQLHYNHLIEIFFFNFDDLGSIL